jgi:hypothetical protein
MLGDSVAGTWVNLENYVNGGLIDNSRWYNVSIPTDDLKSDTFTLNSVFVIYFARMMGNSTTNGCYTISGYIDNPTAIPASCDTPQDFFIDNIVLKPKKFQSMYSDMNSLPLDRSPFESATESISNKPRR